MRNLRRQRFQNRAIASAPIDVTSNEPDKINRALVQISEQVNRLATEGPPYYDIDLVVGTNRINHGLGRPAVSVVVVPATANASFAWAFNPTQTGNSQPHLQAWIVVAGTAMRARVFFL